MNLQEREAQTIENQEKDADLLIVKMFSFIPIVKDHPTSAIISAKYCAKAACDYLIEKLPNINDTPPIHRNNENTYAQYWKGVKHIIANKKFL